MMSINSSAATSLTQAERIANLPHYNTCARKDLPADAAPMGVLADGGIYFDAYEMLTDSDIEFLQAATGRSFDSATIAAEQSAGTFKDDPLAAAIGFDRADSVLGGKGLTGEITSDYLDSVMRAVSNAQGDGTYHGFHISKNEFSAAISALGANSTSIDVSV